LSSILEALKKAERESTGGRDADLPLPAPLPKRSPYPMVRRRWWLPLCAVGMLCIGIVIFWQLQRPVPSRPVAAPAPSAAPETPEDSPLPARRAERPKPSPAPEKEASAVAQAPAAETALAPRAKAPSAKTAPVQPAHQPDPKVLSPVVAKASPARPPETRPRHSAPAPESKTASSNPPRVASRPPTPPLEKSDKTYRSDSRIELQALVWSPDAAQRFVIVNDRLIKEGGSIEGITVVRINPDDVLVSEGSKRWHEPFKIR